MARAGAAGLDADMSASDHVVADQEAVFALLADPATYGVRDDISRIDTHGAVVFLAGADVYKVKRAVRFSFMDFSTLEKRRRACAREVELNRATAPELYLGLTPIVRWQGQLHLGGEGDVVEWAVHMRRFDENATLDQVMARAGAEGNGLTPPLVTALAEAVERAHRHAPVVAGTSGRELRAVARNVVAGLREAPEMLSPAAVSALEAAFLEAFDRLEPLLARRAAAGEVRRCHGDLHLRNIALIDGAPVLFDALEFDEALASIDRLYDLAFLIMDLALRGRAFEANLLLNRYLIACGDAPPYDGLAALPLFLALRAAIRAQVSAAAAAQRTGAARAAMAEEACAYLAFAQGALVPRPVKLVAVGGLSGSGKSTLAAALAPRVGPLPGAVHLRSDIERKRLNGTPELERLPQEAYSMEATQAVYATLRARAEAILAAGHGVIVDGVHQRPDERADIAALAHEGGVDFLGLWLEAPVESLTGRGRRGGATPPTPRRKWCAGRPGARPARSTGCGWTRHHHQPRCWRGRARCWRGEGCFRALLFRRAGAGVVDHVLEALIVERGGDLERADQIDRRARQAEGLGLLVIALEKRADVAGMGLEVLGQLRPVDAGIGQRFAHALGGGFAGQVHQGLVGEDVFVLVVRGQGELGGDHGGFRQDRPVLVDEADLAILVHQTLQLRQGFAAIPAIIVEEGDDGDIALGVAEGRGLRVVQQGVDIERLGRAGRRGHVRRRGNCRKRGAEHGAGGGEEQRAALHRNVLLPVPRPTEARPGGFIAGAAHRG
ncbi:aminoglycoside phosphotransferase family enzyme [Ancylobacter aquaticus]|uniref:Aminoglycoside phosphotransferase family enzyme n=1 Tax=Ancylobacter aquaticus TaxID=100 RepID=A0A4V2PI72_ANCAQ|nr:aminoglycoside phosphotransferase family enzyme [Ancylobacter aquaticus]